MNFNSTFNSLHNLSTMHGDILKKTKTNLHNILHHILTMYEDQSEFISDQLPCFLNLLDPEKNPFSIVKNLSQTFLFRFIGTFPSFLGKEISNFDCASLLK